MKPTHRLQQCVLFAVLITTVAACNEEAPDASRTSPGEAAAPAGESGADRTSRAPAPDTEPEVSDLDRPVEELMNLTCEHGKKTYQCPECRYETGFVRAPESLFAGGLMRIERVARQNVRVPLLLTGEVRFDERRVTHVSTQAEGIVRKAHVALGDKVRAGQPLIEIESAAVGEAEGAYLEAQAVLRLARRSFERLSTLRDKAITSEKDYLQAQQELEAAEIRSDAALGRLTRLGMAAADATALTQASARGTMVLRAPACGTVLLLHAVPGEVAKGDEALATIGDNATVWVWADLYEGDIARVARELRAGRLPAVVSIKAYPGVEFPGTVDFMSPLMEESSRTVKLRVEVQNPDGRLLAGMFANVKVFLPGDGEALVVPKTAVLEDEGRSFVFIHHDGDYYVRRPVAVGREWGDRVEVVRGLSGGEAAVVDGSFLMKSDVLRSKMGAGCAD